jgi:sulfoxide reductase catalytic subunit YedY
VPHPRWSQPTEEDLATKERHLMLLCNGYGVYVAHLYGGLEKERCGCDVLT